MPTPAASPVSVFAHAEFRSAAEMPFNASRLGESLRLTFASLCPVLRYVSGQARPPAPVARPQKTPAAVPRKPL
jgi:hypothetical protein